MLFLSNQSPSLSFAGLSEFSPSSSERPFVYDTAEF